MDNTPLLRERHPNASDEMISRMDKAGITANMSVNITLMRAVSAARRLEEAEIAFDAAKQAVADQGETRQTAQAFMQASLDLLKATGDIAELGL